MAYDDDTASLFCNLDEVFDHFLLESRPPSAGFSPATSQDSHLLRPLLQGACPSNDQAAGGEQNPFRPHNTNNGFYNVDKAYPWFPEASPLLARFLPSEFPATRCGLNDPHLLQPLYQGFCRSNDAAAGNDLTPFCPHNAVYLNRFHAVGRPSQDHGLQRYDSPLHANRFTQPLPASPDEQATAEFLRQRRLLLHTDRTFCGNPYGIESILGDVSWCSNIANGFDRLSLSPTPPTFDRIRLRRVTNRYDVGSPKRALSQPVRREADKFQAGNFAGEPLTNKLEDIARKDEDLSFPFENQQVPRYTLLEEVKGRMVAIAKDHHGYRFLESKCKSGSPEEVETIFSEIRDHLCELVFNPFGNYVVDSLLDGCDARQRMEIVTIVTWRCGLLFRMSIHQYAEKLVRKLIATIRTPEEISLVCSALRSRVVTLLMDSTAFHVVQTCLKNFSNKDCEFLIDEAMPHCIEIATHKIGCIHLQSLLEQAEGQRKYRLINEICENALCLTRNRFGNFVVQDVIEGHSAPWAKTRVFNELKGYFVSLSMNKFSSNVVEKCLRVSVEKEYTLIVRELLEFPDFLKLVKDHFGNYVVQSALKLWKGSAIHNDLVDRILADASAFRCPIGRMVLQRLNSELRPCRCRR